MSTGTKMGNTFCAGQDKHFFLEQIGEQGLVWNETKKVARVRFGRLYLLPKELGPFPGRMWWEAIEGFYMGT